MSAAIDPAAVRHGRAHSRYFRENYAQGGLDLVQVVPELVTNADAAIAAGGRQNGRIHLRFGRSDPEFVRVWRRSLRSLGVPIVFDWRSEVSCTDDGEGVDSDVVDRRLGALGVVCTLLATGLGIYGLWYWIDRSDFPGPLLGGVAVLFVLGIQGFLLALVGEYLGRIQREVEGRPLYSISEEL